MKMNEQFFHDKEGFNSCGITKERNDQIYDFLNDLIREGKENQLKRSEVLERIIEFSSNVIEVAVISGCFEQKLFKFQKRDTRPLINSVELNIDSDVDDKDIEVIAKKIIKAVDNGMKKIQESERRAEEGDDILRRVGLN